MNTHQKSHRLAATRLSCVHPSVCALIILEAGLLTLCSDLSAMADWSLLPSYLVKRIADRILATDDLDYYMDLRAVCRGWRSSTADPKSWPLDTRFRPRQWAMLDEVHQSDARLFVNAGTGRFVRRDLPPEFFFPADICRKFRYIAFISGARFFSMSAKYFSIFARMLRSRKFGRAGPYRRAPAQQEP
jgi:hypothetical protein